MPAVVYATLAWRSAGPRASESQARCENEGAFAHLLDGASSSGRPSSRELLRDSVVHQWTLLCKLSGAISRKSLISKTHWCVQKATNQGVVGSSPAGRARFQGSIPVT